MKPSRSLVPKFQLLPGLDSWCRGLPAKSPVKRSGESPTTTSFSQSNKYIYVSNLDSPMASSVTPSPHFLFFFPQTRPHSTNPHRDVIIPQLHRTSRIQASRRLSNFPQEGDNLVDDPRNWSRNRALVMEDYDDEEEDEEDEEEEDRSLDLLVRFVENMFKKISRKARKAVRSVLPFTISTKLVGFSVNGVIMLAFLWILKAFLEVVCTLGSAVFVSILAIRGIWAGIFYLQESRNRAGFDNEPDAWTGVRPAT